MITFLDKRSELLEAIKTSKNMAKEIKNATSESNITIKDKENKVNKSNSISMSLITTGDIKCYMYYLPHTVYKYLSFLALSPYERIKKVNDFRLCRICLRKHEFKKCSALNYFKCNKPYNTLLHIFQKKNG